MSFVVWIIFVLPWVAFQSPSFRKQNRLRQNRLIKIKSFIWKSFLLSFVIQPAPISIFIVMIYCLTNWLRGLLDEEEKALGDIINILISFHKNRKYDTWRTLSLLVKNLCGKSRQLAFLFCHAGRDLRK